VTDESVASRLTELGVSRITHFTSSRNLPRILGSGQILSTAALRSSNAIFDVTDQERWDGHPELICCNIDYPNFYYFAKATQKENAINYSDWAVLLLDPAVATQDGTLFAPGNAAKNGGADLVAGVVGLDRMYASPVYGWRRASSHRQASPTDVQAEVLIPGPIDNSAVIGIVMPDESSFRREVGRLEQVGQDPHPFNWYVSPGLFRRESIVAAVRNNQAISAEGPCETMQQEEQ